MIIAIWNLRHNHAATIWPRFQKTFQLDLLFLQESRQPIWDRGMIWERVTTNKWGSGVLVSSGHIRAIPIAGYEGWVVGGEWIERGTEYETPLFVFSIHAPTPSKVTPRAGYIKEVCNIATEIRSVIPSEADVVLGGDFNFISLGERAVGEKFQTTKAERDALKQIEGLGLVSCWSKSHPGRPLSQTLRWGKDKSKGYTTPFHCDGIFIPAEWAKNGLFCEVLTSRDFEKSDHNPMVAWVAKS